MILVSCIEQQLVKSLLTKYVLYVKSEKYQRYTLSDNDNNRRVDNIIRKFLNNMPLKTIFKHIRSGDIRVNEKKIKQNYRVNTGDILYIYKPLLQDRTTKKSDRDITPLNSKRVKFQNKHILIYNKERGVIVHGERDSLDKRVKKHLENITEKSLSFSSGPLHRLDRNTQGLITFSVSLKGARTFTEQLQNREIRKFYLTIVDGNFSKKEHFIDYIDRDEKEFKSYNSKEGKRAESYFTPLINKQGKTISLIEIKSGRTHQIRIQCSIHNRPLTGDRKYNPGTTYKEYYLAAISLTFPTKSDIVNISEVVLPVEQTTSSLLQELLTKEEISRLNLLIQKEVKQL